MSARVHERARVGQRFGARTVGGCSPAQGSPARARPKALVVRQPWASLIASGRKTVELRSWTTSYRGPLLILAGSSVWRGTEYPIGPRGVALCWVDLVDVRKVTPDDATAACIVPPEGYDHAWVLSSPRAVRQVPTKGRLGLYAVPDDLLAEVGP